MRGFYDRIGGGFTVFCAACIAFIIVFSVAWMAWGPPTKTERIEKLEDRVAKLEAEQR